MPTSDAHHTLPAFVLSLALHVCVLFPALSGGAGGGVPDGVRTLSVEILTEDRAAAREKGDPGRSERPEEAGAAADPSKGEAGHPPAAMAAAPSALGGTRLVEAVESAFVLQGGDREGPAGDPVRSSARQASQMAPQSERAGSATDRAVTRHPAPPSDPDARARGRAATGGAVRRTASLGSVGTRANLLPPSIRDALIALLQRQIEPCYVPPAGAERRVVLPVIGIRLAPDGTLGTPPRIVQAGASTVDAAVAQAALKAVRRCAPFGIPARFAPYYAEWRDIVAEFEFALP